jgi:hypothetical protein
MVADIICKTTVQIMASEKHDVGDFHGRVMLCWRNFIYICLSILPRSVFHFVFERANELLVFIQWTFFIFFTIVFVLEAMNVCLLQISSIRVTL